MNPGYRGSTGGNDNGRDSGPWRRWSVSNKLDPARKSMGHINKRAKDTMDVLNQLLVHLSK